MKVHEAPQPDKVEYPDAEALIEEARQRQRKRRFFIGIVVLLVAIGSCIWALSNGGSATKLPSSSKKQSHVKSIVTVHECAPGELSISPVGWANPSQLTYVLDMQLVNTSSSSCSLWGYPQVVISNGSHSLVPDPIADHVPAVVFPSYFHPVTSRRAAVVVGPGKVAAFYLETSVDQGLIVNGKCDGFYSPTARFSGWKTGLSDDIGLATCPGLGVSVSAVGLQPQGLNPESPPPQP